MSESIIKNKSYLFAKRTVQLYKYLTEKRKEFILSKQVLRSGTAVGALVREAQNSESTADFIHKLAIAQKEFDSLYQDSSELLRMIRSAIITSKSKTRKNL